MVRTDNAEALHLEAGPNADGLFNPDSSGGCLGFWKGMICIRCYYAPQLCRFRFVRLKLRAPPGATIDNPLHRYAWSAKMQVKPPRRPITWAQACQVTEASSWDMFSGSSAPMLRLA
jgi:hypothetical protein